MKEFRSKLDNNETIADFEDRNILNIEKVIEKYNNYFMPSGGVITIISIEPIKQLKYVTEHFTHIK